MNEVTLIGIDLAKHVFHVHGQDAKGHAIFRKKLSRLQLLPFHSLATSRLSPWSWRRALALTGWHASSLQWGMLRG